ncbi:hypothetical protein [Streptomyces flaveolus]|uniref:hypothetical protein n=1 Tax=Streptomyces flaveolus TaxID=67297 RepID=UPI0036FCCA33
MNDQEPTAEPAGRREPLWRSAEFDDARELGGEAADVRTGASTLGDTDEDTGTTAGTDAYVDAAPDGSSPDPDTENLSQESAPSRPGLTRALLAGAVGLCLLLLVLPAMLLDDGPQRAGAPQADKPVEDLSLEYPPPSASAGNGGTSVSPAPSPQPSTAAPDSTSGLEDDTGPTPTTGAAQASATSSRSTVTLRVTGEPRAAATARDDAFIVVRGTSVLEPGQSWSAGRIALTLENDGDLVLHDAGGQPLWRSETAGQGARTVFQSDGNLVVYTADMRAAWSSRTEGHHGATLVVSADGDVAVQDGGTVLWSIRTAA